MNIKEFDLEIKQGAVIIGEKRIEVETRHYTKTVKVFGRKCILDIDPPKADIQVADYLRAVEESLDWINLNEENIKEYIANDIVPLRNGPWKGARKLITAQKVINQLIITDLSIESTCAMTLYFDVKQMFDGHIVTIDIGEKGQLKEVKIQG